MQWNRAVPAFCIVSAILSTTMLTALISSASGSEFRPCLQSRFFRIDNVQYSSQNVTVGETLKITGELRSLVNRDVSIKPILPIVDREKASEYSQNCEPPSFADADKIAASPSEWSVVNTSFANEEIDGQFSLGAGENIPFSIEIKSGQPGTFGLTPGFVLLSTEANGTQTGIVQLGRGAMIQVTQSEELLQRCQELGIPMDECDQIAVLQQSSGGPIRTENPNTNAIFLPIGIGAVIAGVIAFVALRKLR